MLYSTNIRVCLCIYHCFFASVCRSHWFIYRGADKSLARPGMKQPTATKL